MNQNQTKESKILAWKSYYISIQMVFNILKI